MRIACASLVFALAACGGAARTGELTVCLRANDPPRSVAGLGGFDVDVAELVADGLHRHLEVVWLPEAVMTEIESTDISYHALLAGRCDLMLSIPGADAIAGLTGKLALSAPYYGAGFELIPHDGELGDAVKVAVRANTVAHVVIDARGYDWTMQPDSAAIATAVRRGEAGVGLVWGPELALLDVPYNAAYEPPRILRWNQHAVVRKDHASLLVDVNAVFAANGEHIMRLLRAHGIPDHPPFASTHQSAVLRAISGQRVRRDG